MWCFNHFRNKLFAINSKLTRPPLCNHLRVVEHWVRPEEVLKESQCWVFLLQIKKCCQRKLQQIIKEGEQELVLSLTQSKKKKKKFSQIMKISTMYGSQSILFNSLIHQRIFLFSFLQLVLHKLWTTWETHDGCFNYSIVKLFFFLHL